MLDEQVRYLRCLSHMYLVAGGDSMDQIINKARKLWILLLLRISVTSALELDFQGNLGNTADGGVFGAEDELHDRVEGISLPLVVNTWTGDFSLATMKAWAVISTSSANTTLLDAIEKVRAIYILLAPSCFWLVVGTAPGGGLHITFSARILPRGHLAARPTSNQAQH